MGKLTFTAFDLGGHDQARRVWNQYFPAVDSVVFVVDAADRKVMSKVVYELDKLLNDEQISHCPILVLGNKKDRLDAMGEDELRYSLGLHGRTTGKDKVPRETLMTRPIELFMASVVRGEGYGEGFRWLAQYL
ncbi:hypothetical protein EB796_011900 [Bugula neritina]|uniref:small monomeric GTPase n=1 Tax=Bugula neritina TaxID=10212 RepID=A0A7J7JTV3_BUGNE|nr:hypothetical protein EB796_011900 [Bugula neritina]